ncbi:MAG: HlyD family efflux transporter periplasmic adaptor subunit [Candidatus Omnitrophica bacterium]|nr:HlyD family efflux transporter periplasmic adaptor subunit [Candidatus Omnitrophota bacterium]MCB9721686.1 HlyD family efflux transporter periplasmic adaptor subunit [Candidatus Omnitrophota bacterium]
MISLILWSAAACDGHGRNSAPVYSGSVELTEHSLGFAASGRIENLLVEEGDRVSQGQRLALLDHFNQAVRDAERAQHLLDSGGFSRQEYEHLRQVVDDMQLIAPVDGVILNKIRENGEVTAAGAPVLVIGDTNRVWVKIYVPEHTVTRLRIGQPARVRVDGLERDLPARISSIAAQAEFTPRNVQTPEERTMQMFGVKVQLDDPSGVRPGIFADVEILTDERSGH